MAVLNSCVRACLNIDTKHTFFLMIIKILLFYTHTYAHMIEFQPMTMIFVSYDYLLLQITTSFDFQRRQNLNLKSPIQQ